MVLPSTIAPFCVSAALLHARKRSPPLRRASFLKLHFLNDGRHTSKVQYIICTFSRFLGDACDFIPTSYLKGTVLKVLVFQCSHGPERPVHWKRLRFTLRCEPFAQCRTCGSLRRRGHRGGRLREGSLAHLFSKHWWLKVSGMRRTRNDCAHVGATVFLCRVCDIALCADCADAATRGTDAWPCVCFVPADMEEAARGGNIAAQRIVWHVCTVGACVPRKRVPKPNRACPACWKAIMEDSVASDALPQ